MVLFTRMSNHLQHINLQEIIRLESQYHANNYTGHHHNAEVQVISGHLPILIAAPHSVVHLRNKTPKKAETITGTIATLLARTTGTNGIILSKTNGEDPNYDANGPFKNTLRKIINEQNIKCVINLHGMTSAHPWDLVFGSNLGRNLGPHSRLLSLAVETMHDAGFNRILVDDDSLFNASHPHNLSSYSWNHCNTPSFQLEINRHYRNPIHQPQKFHQLITGLNSAIMNIAKDL